MKTHQWIEFAPSDISNMYEICPSVDVERFFSRYKSIIYINILYIKYLTTPHLNLKISKCTLFQTVSNTTEMKMNKLNYKTKLCYFSEFYIYITFF
jgi:hypothetical protein